MADLDDLEIGPDASDLADPGPAGPFMPAPEDRSYIANEYRLRVEEINRLRAALESIAKNDTEDCEIYTLGCDCHEVAQKALKKE